MTKQMKVGLFVILGMLLVAAAIFLIGDSKKLWEPKVEFRAAFKDVAGLKAGTPVRMGGLDIGTVMDVSHGNEGSDTRIYVKMSVVKNEAQRIRSDTIARVVPKGLLGDKMIELSVSESGAPPQDPTQLMKSEEPRDMLANANELAKRAQGVIEKIEPLAQSLGDPRFGENIKGSAQSINDILDAIAHKDSIAHRMLFDGEDAKKFSAALTNFQNASAQLSGVLADVKDMTGHVKSGPGIAHAVIYDGDLSKNASGVMAELHKDLVAIREGNGIAKAIIYGDDNTQRIMGNLHAMSEDMRQIVSGVRQGKGTLGALLVDPSVYEDIKAAIGNVERNQVLRALVRYSIKQDEQKPHVQTPQK
jgi:phospholipid/cholesterol/gamma-HCH transport system substrate-binding protein